MEPRDYAAAVARRWAWVVVAGLAGLLGGGVPALATPPEYQAGVALYVDAARVDGPEDPASAARVQEDVLPSVVRLAGSPAVLASVRDQLAVPRPVEHLARAVDADLAEDTNVLQITATAASAREAADRRLRSATRCAGRRTGCTRGRTAPRC